MAYILNIETSTKNCSVALAKNGEIVLCKEIAEIGFSHAEKLHVFLEELLKETELSFKDINAIAVSQGPGSYTGLRIGVSAAKGLCYALDIPLIAVDTMQILANQVTVEEGIIIPMIDARRMEVFSAIFDKNHLKIRETKAEVLEEHSFAENKELIYIVGDCAAKAKTVLINDNFIFLEKNVYPSAKEMATLSYELFKQNTFVDVAYFEPFYLKDFMLTQKS
ncbi:MAG TPA: tRNA (adenosine(37)-N6)-threonylcarbamoyltransferase complex dimerization subunit type 1 TsaB [Flavobacterium sp.]|nr:tRNA (adenosine(37)-N6)-threonylcarbamoyltransferase complex dimerization subunit type 1 TsaB [Flavobacterium sp.]